MIAHLPLIDAVQSTVLAIVGFALALHLWLHDR